MSDTTQDNYQTEHCYIEVGGDLLSKPSSLSDFLEQQGFPTAIIFCNTPSDTDLLEVLLKKRGLAAAKLIGYVPPQKLEQTLARVQAKEITTLVVTDIAARNIDLGAFDVVVNYSIQNDGEVYLQRAGLSQGSNNETAAGDEVRPTRRPARRIFSLVGPLDIANFHFLKKAADVEFTKLDPPTKEDIAKARVQYLAKKAATSPFGSDENYRAMAQQVLSHDQKESVVAFLLQSTLELVPQLSSDLEKAISERDAFGMDEGVQPGAFQPGQRWRGGDDDHRGGGRGQGGRGQGSRGGQGRDRGGRRGGDFEDSRDDRPRNARGGDTRGNDSHFEGSRFENNDDDNFNRGGDADEGFGDSDRRGRGGRGQGGQRRGGRDERRDSRPPRNITRIKDDRIYIGLGARDGFSEDQFVDLIKQEGVDKELLKKFSLRENYSFADLPEEQSAKILESLKDRELSGKKLFITKAVTLTTTIELPPEEGFGDDSGGDAHSMHGDDHHEAEHSGAAQEGAPQGEDSADGPQTLEDSYR